MDRRVLKAVTITFARLDSDHGSKLPENLDVFVQFLLILAADVPIREGFKGEARQSAALGQALGGVEKAPGLL